MIVPKENTQFSFPNPVVQLTDSMVGQLGGISLQKLLTKQSWKKGYSFKLRRGIEFNAPTIYQI